MRHVIDVRQGTGNQYVSLSVNRQFWDFLSFSAATGGTPHPQVVSLRFLLSRSLICSSSANARSESHRERERERRSERAGWNSINSEWGAIGSLLLLGQSTSKVNSALFSSLITNLVLSLVRFWKWISNRGGKWESDGADMPSFISLITFWILFKGGNSWHDPSIRYKHDTELTDSN